MRAAVTWTEALDGRLCALRIAGATWDGIARDLGLGRNTVLERGRRIGARQLQPAAAVVLLDHKDRAAYPPGHPATWGLITRGTVLDGEAYPFPVFL